MVGGCVRDKLLKREFCDIDIATSALPEQVRAVFAANPAVEIIPTGEKHGTLTVRFPLSGNSFEVTTYRLDGEYSDSRRPESVEFVADIAADLSRRDFTVNAIAYDVFSDEYIDPFGGIADIQRKIIRAVGNPAERFTEDALRIMRALRFSAVLGFEIEAETRESAISLVPKIRNVSSERISGEFVKTLTAEFADDALISELGLRIVEQIMPEFRTIINVPHENKWHCCDIYEHTLKVVSGCSGRTLRLAAFFHDLGKGLTKTRGSDGYSHYYGHQEYSELLTRKIMTRLRFSTREIDLVCTLVLYHDAVDGRLSHTSAFTKRLLNKISPETFELLLDLSEADVRAHVPALREHKGKILAQIREDLRYITANKLPYSVRDLALSGSDIMREFSLPPGPLIGELLEYCVEAVIDGTANEKAELLTVIRSKLAE
jgi:tRNA nucleotidyltransferase (CCA-adding enzyme)